MSIRKLMIYPINGSKYCAKIECNTMITAPRRLKHLSRGANRPSDIAVTVNITAEFDLSLIGWQLTLEVNAFQESSSPGIVTD